MNNSSQKLLALTLLFGIILSGCNYPAAPDGPGEPNPSMGSEPVVQELPPETAPSANPTSEETGPQENPPTLPDADDKGTPSTPEDAPRDEPPADEKKTEEDTAGEENFAPAEPELLGPCEFPDGTNPLTGLLAQDPDLLALPPALLSVSNFPASARPQAGLNDSAFTFEMTIGEGMTRFLALFYGQFPEAVSGQKEGAPAIGPIRSGRLPYEDLRALFDGFLVMASADSGVAQTLSDATSIYGSDGDDINSALISIETLAALAQSQGERTGRKPNLEGLCFSPEPPAGGQRAEDLHIFYSSLNQIKWTYDPARGAYVRHDITTDGSGEFPVSTDRLTGESITKENLIVLFAHHDFKAPTLIDIHLTNMPPMPALLLRDGVLIEIFWTTAFGDYEKETGLMRPIRFVDAEGNPVPLKPGQTWVHIVTDYSYFFESARVAQPFYAGQEENGSGYWLVRFKGKY